MAEEKKAPKAEPKETTAEEAAAIIQKKQKETLDLCGKEVGEVLERHGCTIQVQHIPQIVFKQK